MNKISITIHIENCKLKHPDFNIENIYNSIIKYYKNEPNLILDIYTTDGYN